MKSSLKATEPQAVITRKFIEESTPRVGDFTTTAMLAPSMTGVPNANGPGATDGATDNVLRSAGRGRDGC